MAIWLTSDTHFGHANILKFQPRDFASVEDMDEHLIKCWNERVKKTDLVCFLGDFIWRTRGFDAMSVLVRLNGDIYFLPGNHDHWIRNFQFGTRFHLLDQIHTLRHNGSRIVLCHYALKTWHQKEKGYLHAFGHSHGNLIGEKGSMDVGVDTNNYYPYHVDEVIERLK